MVTMIDLQALGTGEVTEEIEAWYQEPARTGSERTGIAFKDLLNADIRLELSGWESTLRYVRNIDPTLADIPQILFCSSWSLNPQTIEWISSSNLVERILQDVGKDVSESAVEVVSRLERELRLPLRTILRAAGIKRRTFYSWRDNPIVAPRTSSLGRLWALVQCIDDLYLEQDDVWKWIAAPSRIALLQNGRFDELIDESASGVREQTEMARLPPYRGDDSVIPEWPVFHNRPKTQRSRTISNG
jgi:hypothetical protein